MKTIAVIGANFGDEGKGRIVDQFASASNKPVVVIRYNGGSQAGHTVVTPDNKKHIFSHFGSGTLSGAKTYLSEYFIANPYIFKKESIELAKEFNIIPEVSYHKDMPVSTPYDMYINREIETFRFNNRHGSCGYGVAETVERLCNSSHGTFISNYINNENKFRQTLKDIKEKYVLQRLKKLGVDKPSDLFMEWFEHEGLLNEYYEALDYFIGRSTQRDYSSLMKLNTIIFEGSQGLALDERHKFFPHVTRSKTGLDNIIDISKKISSSIIKEIEVIYVTRAYLTRHGNGPLPTENKDLHYEDETNITNEWQGELRFGCLDLDLLKENITTDINRNKNITGSPKLNISIAITCLDQISDMVEIKYKEQIKKIDKSALPALVSKVIGASKVYISKTNYRK
jgi:adenylosuccinate synthase